MRKSYLLIIISLIEIFVACGKPPLEEDPEHNTNQPNLEAILQDMVLIPAGEFLMGSLEGERAFDEHSQHVVSLDDYSIDKYKVTNVQFKEFVETTRYVKDKELRVTN